MPGFPPEPGEYDGEPVPQEDVPIRYVLRAMTLEDAHKQGFSTKWFDERAKTRDEMRGVVGDAISEEDGLQVVEALAALVSWPTRDRA